MFWALCWFQGPGEYFLQKAHWMLSCFSTTCPSNKYFLGTHIDALQPFIYLSISVLHHTALYSHECGKQENTSKNVWPCMSVPNDSVLQLLWNFVVVVDELGPKNHNFYDWIFLSFLCTWFICLFPYFSTWGRLQKLEVIETLPCNPKHISTSSNSSSKKVWQWWWKFSDLPDSQYWVLPVYYASFHLHLTSIPVLAHKEMDAYGCNPCTMSYQATQVVNWDLKLTLSDSRAWVLQSNPNCTVQMALSKAVCINTI